MAMVRAEERWCFIQGIWVLGWTLVALSDGLPAQEGIGLSNNDVLSVGGVGLTRIDLAIFQPAPEKVARSCISAVVLPVPPSLISIPEVSLP
jgi:hypothetical protein